MYSALFESQDKWSIDEPNPVLIGLARELGIDMSAFETCIADGASIESVQSDMRDGAPIVQGTPTFVVLFNGKGRIIPGALPADRFMEVLQEILDEVE
jgi:predicted DsbA family dithiol-disulfide isomerase